MALDTREKRQAASFISRRFMRPAVTPNSAKDAAWRQEAGWGYPGIPVDAPAVVVTIDVSPDATDRYGWVRSTDKYGWKVLTDRLDT